MSSVVGGAMLPHAPQFFTRPETEDRDTVERVKPFCLSFQPLARRLSAPDTGARLERSELRREVYDILH
jgi:hypothetical protein